MRKTIQDFDRSTLSKALAIAVLIFVAVLPVFLDPLSSTLDFGIFALAYIMFALGLNIVVGFAGLLDLGYVAFYAIGAYSIGWFASDHFAKANGGKGIHIGVSGFPSTLPGIHLNFLLIILAAVVICAGNALVRYVFNNSSNAWLEIQWYLYAAVFMLASSHTLRRDGHVRIDLIVGHFSKRTQVWIDLFGYAFFLLPICLLILWFAIPYARLAIDSGEMSSNAGGLIVWPARILIPIGFAQLVLQGVSEIIKRVAFLAGRSDGSDFARHVTTPEEEIAAIKAANDLE